MAKTERQKRCSSEHIRTLFDVIDVCRVCHYLPLGEDVPPVVRVGGGGEYSHGALCERDLLETAAASVQSGGNLYAVSWGYGHESGALSKHCRQRSYWDIAGAVAVKFAGVVRFDRPLQGLDTRKVLFGCQVVVIPKEIKGLKTEKLAAPSDTDNSLEKRTSALIKSKVPFMICFSSTESVILWTKEGM